MRELLAWVVITLIVIAFFNPDAVGHWLALVATSYFHYMLTMGK